MSTNNLNNLSLNKIWTIPQLSKIVNIILEEDKKRYKLQPNSRNNYVIHSDNFVKYLINQLIKLTDYKEPLNVSKQLKSKSITERLTKLINDYSEKIRDRKIIDINYIC